MAGPVIGRARPHLSGQANNPIGLKGGEALRICMRVCRSVTDLSLTGAGVAAEQLKDIDECVAQNRSDLRVQSRQATKST